MTYEQTREQFVLAWNSNAYLNMCESSDMKNAINALEKQIPKKPQSFDSVPINRCPNCHDVVRVFSHGMKLKFCCWCGQALDWKE